MGTVRGYRRGTSLLWVRRSTAQWPSPLRVCSDLSHNTLTGSVPSSLSALTKLSALFVAPSFYQRRLRCAAEEGRDRLALLRARGMSGVGMSGASSGGGAAAGPLRCSQRGPRARDVTKKYSRGTPSYGVRCAGTVGAHRCCGCGVVPPSGRVRFGCAAPSATMS
jgi:hypothetical protein